MINVTKNFSFTKNIQIYRSATQNIFFIYSKLSEYGWADNIFLIYSKLSEYGWADNIFFIYSKLPAYGWADSFKGTVMQIEKAMTNDRLRISKVS